MAPDFQGACNMRHLANADFRKLKDALPKKIRDLAQKQFSLLKADPKHPSLHFKKLRGTRRWSARVGLGYRAVAEEVEDGVLMWFWIGTHGDYDRLVQ